MKVLGRKVGMGKWIDRDKRATSLRVVWDATLNRDLDGVREYAVHLSGTGAFQTEGKATGVALR